MKWLRRALAVGAIGLVAHQTVSRLTFVDTSVPGHKKVIQVQPSGNPKKTENLKFMIVNVRNLNFRKSPGLDAPSMLKLKQGTIVKYLGDYQTIGDDVWYHISVSGPSGMTKGWVAGMYQGTRYLTWATEVPESKANSISSAAVRITPNLKYKNNICKPSFDPQRYCLMSDDLFNDVNFVSEKELRHFMRNSDLGQPKYRFVELVMKYSRQYNLNPLLFVAKAQSEQSAIRQELTPARLRKMMGYNYPDHRTQNAEYVYYAQIENFGRRIRELYDQASFDYMPINIKFKGDKGDRVKPYNRATYALIAYTPHAPIPGEMLSEGNLAFIRIFDSFCREIKR